MQSGARMRTPGRCEQRLPMPIKRLLLCCVLRDGLISSALAGANALPDIVDIAYQRFVLPNGLTLIVHEDHKAPIVAINIWYHVGSKNERRAAPASPTCSST